MAESSKRNTTIDKPSPSKKPKIENPPDEEKVLDFTFTVRPLSVLNIAFTALADKQFNPSEEVAIQVGQGGCEITVWDCNKTTGFDYFGYLGLEASKLEAFECRNPVFKKFQLTGILTIFKASLNREAKSVTMFSLEGSNKLCFSWGSDFGGGQPFVIDLIDPPARCLSFPEVSYAFEAVLPSPVLRTMFEDLRKRPADKFGRVLLRLKPGTIEVHLPSAVASGSLDVQHEDQKEHRLSMVWGFWQAMISASWTASKCSVYLVTKPWECLMLRFDLEELGDFIFLNQAEFEEDPDELTVLGHFRRLNR